VSAFATVLLNLVQSFGRFDATFGRVEKTSALTLPDRTRRPILRICRLPLCTLGYCSVE
jgi:hypothetical protein